MTFKPVPKYLHRPKIPFGFVNLHRQDNVEISFSLATWEKYFSKKSRIAFQIDLENNLIGMKGVDLDGLAVRSFSSHPTPKISINGLVKYYHLHPKMKRYSLVQFKDMYVFKFEELE